MTGSAPRPDAPPPDASPGGIEEAAYLRLFEEHRRVLWVVAAGVLGDPVGAEDVLQEAAMIGLQKRGEFTPGTAFGAWLGRIVRLVAWNRARHEARRDAVSLSPELAATTVAPASASERTGVSARGELLSDAPFSDELRAGLASLQPIARACLLLKTVLELEYTEIARTLEIPPGTAMSHVHRSRSALRARLAPQAGAVLEPPTTA